MGPADTRHRWKRRPARNFRKPPDIVYQKRAHAHGGAQPSPRGARTPQKRVHTRAARRTSEGQRSHSQSLATSKCPPATVQETVCARLPRRCWGGREGPRTRPATRMTVPVMPDSRHLPGCEVSSTHLPGNLHRKK